MPDYPHTYILVVPAAARLAANDHATRVAPGGEAERLTYVLPLSSSGAAPATHFACVTAASEVMRDRMTAVLAGNTLPGLAFYRLEADSGKLGGTNRAPVASRVGNRFTLADALADMGLRKIQDILLAPRLEL